MRPVKPPANCGVLIARLNRLTGSVQSAELIKRTVACVVVGQMLPAGVVKGGAAMRIRLGTDTTRFSKDLDVSRSGDDLGGFIDELQERLRTGWAGFSGRVAPSRNVSRPAGVPTAYIMRAFDIKLSYNGQPWMTLPLEVGHDEIGDTDRAELSTNQHAIELFTQLGLPQPEPIPLLSVEDQVAQKLHACTQPGSARAHDLVDLQLLASAPAGIDHGRARALCERLFQSRHLHQWPPTLTAGDDWPDLYRQAVDDVEVSEELLDLPEAVAWCNRLIVDIAAAAEPNRRRPPSQPTNAAG